MITIDLNTAVTALDACLYTASYSYLNDELKAARALAAALGPECPQHLRAKLDSFAKPPAQKRLLCAIAADIRKDWGAKMSPHAKPYIDAMGLLTGINDHYGADSGKEIVLYFLANAAAWRGEGAQRIKAELKELVK